MATLGDVRRWRPAVLEDAVGQLSRVRDELIDAGDQFVGARPPATWTGEAAEKAGGEHRKLVDELEEVVGEVAAVRKAVLEAADAITGLGHAIAEAETLARHWEYRIAEDGTIVDTSVAQQSTDPAQLEQLRAHAADRARIKTELEDRVGEIVRRANDIDDDLAKVLWRVLGGGIDGADATSTAAAAALGDGKGGLSTLEPPRNGTPGQNAAWWSSLGPTEQKAVLASHPDWVGNLDGVPAKVRNDANQARIGGERTRLEAELAELRTNPAAAEARRGDDPFAKTRIQEVRDKLASLLAVEDAIGRENKQLLVLDTGGARVKAAIATGDVDTAKHVAVFTPGFTTTVEGSMANYDTGLSALQTKAERMAGASVAAVIWIGYETPQLNEVLGDNSVAAENAAKHGGEKLASFLNGIDAARPGDAPHLTALGHSYGSLTTGHGLQHGTGVDDVVFHGSPGLGTSNINDFKVPAGHAYNITAPGDDVARIGTATKMTTEGPWWKHLVDAASIPWRTDANGWFGINPADMTGMKQLSPDQAANPDGGDPLQASQGHSEYLKDKSTSQHNMAAVVAGHPEKLVDRG